MKKTKFLTNKLPYDLEFTKELASTQFDEENNCYVIKKDDEEFCLSSVNVIFFLKTFYLKETLLYIASILLSFFLGKIFILASLITASIYIFIYTEEEKAEKIYNKLNRYFNILIGLTAMSVAISVIINFFIEISFTYISFLFYTLYLLFTMNFILKYYFKYKNSLYCIKQDNNIIKGYIAWKE